MLYRPPRQRAVACSSGSMTGKSSAEMPRSVDFPRSSPINVPSWDSQLKTSVPTPCQVWLTNRKTVQTIGDCLFNCHPQRRISYTGRILEILSASFMNKVSVVEEVDDHFVCGCGHIFLYYLSEVLHFYLLSFLTSSNPCILGPKAIKQPVDFPPLEDKSFASIGESITNLFVRFFGIFFPSNCESRSFYVQSATFLHFMACLSYSSYCSQLSIECIPKQDDLYSIICFEY